MNKRERWICAIIATVLCVHSSVISAEEVVQDQSEPINEPEQKKEPVAPAHTAAPEPVVPVTTAAPTITEAPVVTNAPVEEVTPTTPAPEVTDAATQENTDDSKADTSVPEVPYSTPLPDGQQTNTAENITGETDSVPEISVPQGENESNAGASENTDVGESGSPNVSDTPELDTETPEPEPTPVAITEDQAVNDPGSDKEIRVVKLNKNPGFYGAVPCSAEGMQIPLLFQGDYNETICYIGNSAHSVATSGCGATCVSMVVAYLTGDTHQTPYSQFCRAVERGQYHGNGLDHGVLSQLASDYGVHSKWISNSASEILAALRDGKPVIAHMGPGLFTNYGHYIVLRGVTEDGKILVNDPNSRKNSKYAFPVEVFLQQARSSSSFMVCWSDDPVVNEADVAQNESDVAPEENIEAEASVELETETTEESSAGDIGTLDTADSTAFGSEENKADGTDNSEQGKDTADLYTIGDHVLIRGSAGTNGKMVATLVDPGAKVSIIGSVLNDIGELWYKVYYSEEDIEGYIRSDLLTDCRPIEAVTDEAEHSSINAATNEEMLPAVEEGTIESVDTVSADEEIPSDTTGDIDVLTADEEKFETVEAGTATESEVELIYPKDNFEKQILYTRCNGVAVYSGLSTKEKPIAIIDDSGTEVKAIDLMVSEDGQIWYEVVYISNGIEGYIPAEQLSEESIIDEPDMEKSDTDELESELFDTEASNAEAVETEEIQTNEIDTDVCEVPLQDVSENEDSNCENWETADRADEQPIAEDELLI